MPDVTKIAKDFLRYSFNDINFNYDSLTDTEKDLCTREEFEALRAWIQEE